MFAEGLDSQTVGYTQTTAAKDAWIQVATQFEGVGGGDVVLSDLISGDFVAVEWDDSDIYVESAPLIQINGEDFFYVSFEETEFWFNYNAGGPDEGTTIEPGTGLWFKQASSDSCTIRFKGEVLSDSSKPVYATAGQWCLVCNPYPKAFTFADVEFDGLVAVEWDDSDIYVETAPLIQANGEDFFYVSFEDAEFWFNYNAGGPDEGTEIPVGLGFWFKAATDVTATFSLK